MRLKNTLAPFPDLLLHEALCMLRVYALYGRSRRVLGVLLFLGTGSIVTALVGLFPPTLRLAYACLIIVLIIKSAISTSRHVGGETTPVLSRFAGCAQFTPPIGYVNNPEVASYSLPMNGLGLGVDVSHRVTYNLVTVVT